MTPPSGICHAQAMVTASAEVQWGDVASWVGGGATAIALLLTYALLRITRGEQRDLQSEKHQAQARLISAWSGQIQQVTGDIHDVTCTLQNSSDEPIYGMRAAVGNHWRAENIRYAELDLEYIMPPKSCRDKTTSLELPRTTAESSESSLPVELLFRDAAGRYWHRDRYGGLTRIAERPPIAGGKYFFKPTAGTSHSAR